ncbi:MAG: pitrilysin family protein, partial [Ferruginibacter sp.]
MNKTSIPRLNRKIPPPLKDAVNYKLHLKPYELFTLDNGVPVYSIHAGAQEVVQIEFIFYAGNFFETKKGVAAATNFLLRNGTTSHSALEINEAFEYYGAWCNRACHNETASVSLHSLSKYTERLLPVIKDMLIDSVFLQTEMDIFKQNSQQRLLVSLQKAEFVAGRLIDSYIYGEEHPYGTYNMPEDIEAIQQEDLISFYRKYYLEGQLAIFISGHLPENWQQMLNENFGKLNVSKPVFKQTDKKISPVADKKFRIENDANSVQGAIRIAAPFPNRHHPDFKKVMVLNNLFGGFFGSRLMSNIREDKGYTYGIYSYIENHTQQTAWMISTEAGKDVCEATIAEVYKEMEKLRIEPIESSELALVRNYMIGIILGDLDGPFHIMAKWKNIILNDLEEDYFYDSIT